MKDLKFKIKDNIDYGTTESTENCCAIANTIISHKNNLLLLQLEIYPSLDIYNRKKNVQTTPVQRAFLPELVQKNLDEVDLSNGLTEAVILQLVREDAGFKKKYKEVEDYPV